MNTSLLQRLTFLALLPLCTLAAITAARAADPPATAGTPSTVASAPAAPASAAPASAAPAPAADADTDTDTDTDTDASDHTDEADRHSDWQDSLEGHGHRHRHHHDEHDNDVVNIGSNSNLASGEQADSVVSIFGSSTSDGEAGNVVSVFGDTRVTGEVHDSAVAVFGDSYIDGKIDGDAVAVLGNMQLGPHAEIDGNVTAVGGTLQRDPAAIVHGDVQNVISTNFGGTGPIRTWIHHCLFYGRPLSLAPGLGWAWGVALTFLALYAALALLFGEGLTRCVQTFETQPGQSVLAALIAMLLTPVLIVLLCITVIGIAAVPFVLLALFCIALFGKAVMLAWVGRRVTGRHDAGPLSHPAVVVLIGGVLVLVLYLVPVLGFLVYKLLGVLGLGAVVYTVILAARAHQAARTAPGGTTAAATPGPTPGATPAPGPTPMAQAAMSNSVPPTGAAPTGGDAASPGAAPAMGDARPPVTAALPRAGFWIRMAALLIDILLVVFLTGMLHHSHDLELVVLAAYGAMMWKLRGATVGNIVFDLQVVRLDGRAIDWETAIVRALSCFLSLIVAGLGFIWIAFDGNNQAWHDKIAGTVVVRVVKSPPLL
jgi:RDD family